MTFETKCEILGQFWFEFRDDEKLKDFIEYNDIGLPLSFMIAEDIVASTPVAEAYINECWDLLCAALKIESKQNYDSLADMFLDAGVQEE